jgi:hypothetical protein
MPALRRHPGASRRDPLNLVLALCLLMPPFSRGRFLIYSIILYMNNDALTPILIDKRRKNEKVRIDSNIFIACHFGV